MKRSEISLRNMEPGLEPSSSSSSSAVVIARSAPSVPCFDRSGSE